MSIIGGPVETIAEAREMATRYPHDYAIRTEAIELQGSSKRGKLWVAYVAELSNGDTYRAPFSMAPLPETKARLLMRELQETYPRTVDGVTLWACCESTIGQPCAHNRALAASADAIARVERLR